MNQHHLNIARIRLAWAWASASPAMIAAYWSGKLPLSRALRKSLSGVSRLSPAFRETLER